jgi:hypothetical protein
MKHKALIGPRVSFLAKLGSAIPEPTLFFDSNTKSSASYSHHALLDPRSWIMHPMPGVATNVLRRHGTFPSPHDFLHLRAPQFSTTTSRFAYKKRPPTPLENWEKLEDKWVKEVRQRQRDNGVSEEEINRQGQVATALAAAIEAITLAAGVYYLYSAWMGPGNEEND